MCVNMQKIESEELFPSDAEMEKLSDRYTELMNGKMRQLLTPGKKSIVFKKKKEITTWFSVTRVDAEYQLSQEQSRELDSECEGEGWEDALGKECYNFNLYNWDTNKEIQKL